MGGGPTGLEGGLPSFLKRRSSRAVISCQRLVGASRSTAQHGRRRGLMGPRDPVGRPAVRASLGRRARPMGHFLVRGGDATVVPPPVHGRPTVRVSSHPGFYFGFYEQRCSWHQPAWAPVSFGTSFPVLLGSPPSVEAEGCNWDDWMPPSASRWLLGRDGFSSRHFQTASGDREPMQAPGAETALDRALRLLSRLSRRQCRGQFCNLIGGKPQATPPLAGRPET